MVELTSLQKFKEFIKNSLSLFEINNEKKETIVIEEASWVINEKSHNYFHWYCDVLQRLEYLVEKNALEGQKIKPILLSENYLNIKLYTGCIKRL